LHVSGRRGAGGVAVNAANGPADADADADADGDADAIADALGSGSTDALGVGFVQNAVTDADGVVDADAVAVADAGASGIASGAAGAAPPHATNAHASTPRNLISKSSRLPVFL
jgi:hypothetical protein